jgi:hypothetical protein
MARRPKLPAVVLEGFVQGKHIDPSRWADHNIAIDQAGRVRCIVGYRQNDQPYDLAYYSPSVALREKDWRKSYNFVELSRGALQRTFFLRAESWYRIVEDRWLVLPSGTESYFGVISRTDREEDEQLTRALFGGTRDEIEAVARAFAPIAGRGYHEMLDLPRVTFSKTRNNRCDVTNGLIPREFPYLAFESAQYDWSHISLFGFYRILSFLCPTRAESPVRRALLDQGVADTVLQRFTENGDGNTQPIQVQEPF